MQALDAAILNLDAKWLIVAVAPIIVALFIGGYITKFKGFGVEIESKVANPVSTIDLDATEAFTTLSGREEKSSLDYLFQIPVARRRRISRLVFYARRQGYYSPGIISEYIYELPHLKYFEVRIQPDKFMCLIPVRVFKSDNEINHSNLEQFIRSLENETILLVYADYVITVSVKIDQSLIDVLGILRRTNQSIAAVLDDNSNVMGMVTTRNVEKRIADAVLSAKQRN